MCFSWFPAAFGCFRCFPVCHIFHYLLLSSSSCFHLFMFSTYLKLLVLAKLTSHPHESHEPVWVLQYANSCIHGFAYATKSNRNFLLSLICLMNQSMSPKFTPFINVSAIHFIVSVITEFIKSTVLVFMPLLSISLGFVSLKLWLSCS